MLHPWFVLRALSAATVFVIAACGSNKFAKGDNVLVVMPDGKSYTATIQEVHGETATVQYHTYGTLTADGRDDVVPLEQLRTMK